MAEVVYLIGSPSSHLVKIGRSVKVMKRLGEIQCMSPVPLRVLWTTEGGAGLESALHWRFRQQRVYGEWFDFGVEDPVAIVASAVEETALNAQDEDAMTAELMALGKERRATEQRLAELIEAGVSAAKDALSAGMRPCDVARALGYTDSYIRRLAREAGVPPRYATD
jgi:Meiotically up-regulated gene 113